MIEQNMQDILLSLVDQMQSSPFYFRVIANTRHDHLISVGALDDDDDNVKQSLRIELLHFHDEYS